MKRFLSLLLLVIMLASCCYPVVASNVIEIDTAVDGTYKEVGNGAFFNPYPYNALQIANTESYVTFEVEIPTIGNYIISAKTSRSNLNSDQIMDIYVDGKQVNRHTMPIDNEWPSYPWVDMATCALTAGKHEITLQRVSGTIFMKALKLTLDETNASGSVVLPATSFGQVETQDVVLTTKTIESCKEQSNVSINYSAVTMTSEDAYASFDMEVPVSGTYFLDVYTTRSNNRYNPSLAVYVDGIYMNQCTVTAEEVWPYYAWTPAATVELSAGTHEIKLVNKGSTVYIQSIKLSYQEARSSTSMVLSQSGFYKPVLRTTSDTASAFMAKLYINGAHKAAAAITPTGSPAYDETNFSELYLPEGIHEVALATEQGACTIDSLSFVYLGASSSAAQKVEAEGVSPTLGTSVHMQAAGGGFVVNSVQNQLMKYEVYAPQSGRYALSFTAAECEYFNLAFFTDYGEIYKTYRRSATESIALGTYHDFAVGTIELAKGSNTLTVENMSLLADGGQVILDSFHLTYLGSSGGPDDLVRAGSYSALGGSAAMSGEQLSMTTGGRADYEYLIPASGYYKLTVNAKAANDSMLKVLSKDGNASKLVVRKADAISAHSIPIKLEKGKNTLTCEVEGNLTLESLLIEGPLSLTEASDALCSSVNQAFSPQNIQEILVASKASLFYDAAAMTQGIFNTNPIYIGMQKQSFENIVEVSNAFMQLVFNNLQSPDVALYNEQNQMLPALQNGNLRLEIKTEDIAQGSILVSALYKGSRMIYVSSSPVTGRLTTINLTDIDVSEGDWTFRLFCLDSWSKLTPLAMFTNQAIIYVAPWGNDTTGDGTQTKPLKTIEYAQSLAQIMAQTATGDVVVSLAAGEYTLDETLSFTTADSGIAGKVIYRGAEDGETIISGGTRVSGWQPTEKPQIYRASATGVTDARTLYVNGYAAQRARSKYIYEGLELYTKQGSAYADDGFTVSTHNFPVITYRPQDVELVWRMLWTQQRTPVENIIANQNNTYTILMDQPYWDWARTSLAEYTKPTVDFYGTGGEATQFAKRTFYIENAKELLDEPGEFYFDKGESAVYYYPFPEEDLDSAETYLGTLETMVTVTGNDKNNKVKNLVFENISFKYGAWNNVSVTGKRTSQADKIASGSNQASEVSGGRMIPAQVQFNFAEHVEILNCDFSCLGSGAVSMVDGVTHARVSGNVFHDISGTGLIISSWDHGKYITEAMEKPSHIEVTNNMFRRTGNEFTDTCGISLYYADDIEIMHNYMQDLPYTGITAGWGWQTNEDDPATGCHRIIISHNKFQNVMRTTSDGGAVYMLGNMIDTVVCDNYINGATFGNGGIYFDGGSAHATARDNVVLNVPKWLKKNNWGGRNAAINNFTNMAKSLDIDGNHPSDLIAISGTTYLESDDISGYPKAVSVFQNAGLEPAYAQLAQELDLPAWRTDFATPESEPWYRFVGENSWVDMGDWKGFYDRDGKPNWYRFQLGHFADCIGSFGEGEWLEYDVYIPQNGNYNLTFKAAKNKPSGDVALAFYIDGEKLTEAQVQNFVENEYVVGPIDCGSFALTAGTHRVRVEAAKGVMVLGPFKFDDGAIKTGNDARFDEGVISPS